MSTWNIYHKDGSKLTDVNEEQITVHGLEYSDSWMGECFVTINFKHEVPINFQIGDYIVYRGERFELNYEPGKDKQARPDTYGEGFVYDSVKFNALQDELSRAEFLDVVLNDNELHYTTLPKFPFYVQTLDDLLDRIQANLDDQIGAGLWKIYSRNMERSVQRGCLASDWLSMYGEGTNDNVIESMSITVDSQTCWQALSLVNEKWDINFIVRGRNIYVGTTGIQANHIFKYGLGNGLYEIVQNADSDQRVVTRLRAYGSEKNLPSHYYADLGVKYVANITKVVGASTNVELELDLDYIETYFKNPRKYIVSGETGEQSSGWVLKVTFDFKTEITGYVTQKYNTNKCRFYSEYRGTQVDSGDEESRENLNTFIAQVKAGKTKMYITSGLNKKNVPSSMKEYAENLPNNMSINRLMLPGFPHVSLSDFYDSLTDEEKKYVNPTGKQHRFSTDPHRPYIDSINIDQIGLRSASQFFDTDDKTNGVVEIYPTIEEMVVGGVRVDEIDEGVAPDDDGRYDGDPGPNNVDIYLSKAVDFDIKDLADDDFSISMKDGMCGGRTFKVASSTKVDGRWRLTIERIKDDALELWFPYKDYPIKKGDHFVLTGITLPDSYVNAASLKLLKYAIAFIDKNDYTRYVYQPKVDEIFMARQHDQAEADDTGVIKSLHDTLKAGDLMNFNDTDLNIEGIISIDQLTIKEEDGKIPTYDITLREDKEVGTIQKIQQQISSIKSGNGGTGAGLTTTQVKNQVATEGSKHFISKINDDIAKGTVTWEKVQKFVSGLFVGNFNAENGGSWTPDAEGRSHLITDYLEVRMKAIFEELVINKTSTIGGKEIISPAGGVVAHKVEEVTVTYNNVSQKAYRCYFLAEQEGDAVDNDFAVGDQVRSESFNVRKGTYHKAGNHFYWRLVIGRDEDPVELEGKKYHYIDLSDTDCATASDVPAKGDVLNQCGNRTDVERQNCLIFSAVDTYSPSISLYHGINSYSFANKEFVGYGVNKQTNKAFFNVYGDMYVGDRPTKDNGYEGSSYVKYDSATKQVVIKGKLSAKSTVDGKELSQYIKENSAKGLTEEQVNNIINNSQVIADLQNQVDGAIETWFYDGVPTLTNAPASSWTTNKDKDTHLGDLYYDNKTGKAYRFAKDGNTYKWTIITDTDIAKALADASKAQETADGKMKVFSSQPTPPYQVGDIWVNATYPSDGSTYKNEVLRCQTDKKAGSQFAIADWIKASKYTDDTVANAAKKAAEEAKKAAETAQTNITNLGKTVTINKKAFDSYVKDGYLEPSEIAAMAQDSKRLEDDFAAAEKSYNEVKGAEVLKSTKELTDLNTAFATLTTAKTELVTYLSDISSRYNAADTNGKATIVSAVGTKFTNFQSAYSAFYDKLGLANAYITSKIYGDLKQNITDLAGYKYIKDALGQTTDIDGGLVMTTLLALRDADGNIQSGINGAIDTNRGKKSIATWWGGQMVDKDYNSGSLTPATSLVRFDGSGYLANGAIWWDVDGKVHADPTSFIISEKNLGAYLAFFEPTWKSGSNGTNIKDLVALTPQAPFTTLSVSNDLLVEGKLKIGSITLSVVNGALKIDGNVYSTGGMSAYGEGTSNGGGLNGSIVPFDKAKSLTAQNEGTEIASAWSIKKLYDMINSIDVTGQLADYLKKTEASTLYQPKGNYLTSHQDISGKSDKTHTHSVKINGVTKTIAATGGTAVDLGTYLTSHQSLAAYLKSADAEKTYSKLGHTHAFSEITGKPTTLAGYGVTDGVNTVTLSGSGNAVTSASIDGHTLTLTKGSTFSLSGHTHTFASLTSKPTTIAGYGITDAYTKAQVDSTVAKYLPLAGGTITGALTVNGIATFKSKVAIGDIYIINDGSGNLYVQKTDGKTAANFYATGGITAFGASSVSGGTGGGLNGSVLGFEKATAMTSADNGDSSKTEVSFLATAWSIKQLNDKINAFGTGVFSDYLTIAAAKATYQPKGSYLTSHQTIYGLTIQKNGTSLGTYTPNSAAKTINVTVPTKLSELSNDSGYTKNTGTVTSVAISVPTGLSVSGSPITTHGTIAISLASGYSIPTTAKQTAWDGAVSAKHTHSNKSVLDGISSTKVSHWNSAYDWYALMTTDEETADGIINKWNEVVSFLANIAQTDTLSGIVDGINKSISDEVARAKKAEGVNASGISANKGSIATLQGYFTNGSAKKALQLTNARKLWGNSFNGTADINGSIIVPSGKYISIGNIKLEYDAANKALKITNTTTEEVANLYTSGGVSAYGVGTSSSSGGGLNGSVKSYSDALKLTSESLSEVASAYSIKALDSRISSLEGGSATAISVSGSGNAVTSVTKNGTTISIVKGSTFLTNHQSLDGYVNAISVSGSGNAITSVSKSGKGITFTKGATFLTSHQSLANYYTKSSVDSLLSGKSATSHTHSVKINGITKTIAASGGDAVDLGTYLTAHQSLAAYATQNWVKNEATAHNADMVDNYHASGLFTGFSISDVANKVTISIGGTSKALNLVRAFPSGVGNNFNDIATHGNSMGMSNIAAPYASSTANYQTLNGYVNPNGQTGWHHYINLSYTDSNNTATSPNMWQTQFAIKAGTTEVYVRSRAGGKISNDAAWAAPWVRLARVTDNVASASKVANALSWSGYSSGSYNGSAVKSISIPNNTNQLTNGAGFITSSASITGNAGSATKLQNARTINGTSFNGTANIVTSYWGTTRKLWGNSVNGNADVNGSITIANTDGVYVQIGDVRLVYDKANTAIKVVKSDGTTAANFYATGGISAYGEGSAGTTGSNNFSAKAYADSIKLTSENLSEIASAYSIAVLNNSLNAAIGRISTLEGGSATSIETTGSGNAVTSVSKSGTKITFTKGSTFSLNGHTHDFITVGANQTITATQYTKSRLSVRPYYKSGGPTIYGNILEVVSGISGGGQLGMGWSGGQTKTDGTDTNVGKLYYRSKRDNIAGWTVWKRLAFAEELAWGNISGKPTSLSGYGITDGVNAVSVSGSGNAVTSISKSGTTISVVKGSTFSLSGHTHKWADITDRPSSLKNPSALSWSGYSSGSYDGSAAKSISIPNNTNQLTNGAGFITASASITGNAATATKVNHSLSVFGKSFNGSADVTVADTDLIASISTATANLTDKTEILTSCASDNGFNDSNAKNRIYRRPASAIWGYINSKTISNADKLDNVHLNGIFTALSNTNNGVSMTIGTVAKSLANMQVYSATKLVTARNIALNGDLMGNANFDGSANITINGYMSYCNATVGNTNTYPWRRIAKVNELTGNYSDGCILLYISEGFIGGSYGIARVYIRTDNLSTGANASCSIQWISRNGYGLDSLKIAMYKTTGKAYYDVFLKMHGTYTSVVIRTLQDRRGGLGKRFTLVNSTEKDKAASHTEAYATIEDAATAIHNQAYTSIAQGSDVAMVHNADMVDGIHASGLFTNLSNSGNNISITIGGTNKTLTAAYATNCDTVDGYHAQSGSSKPYGKIPVIGTNGVIELGHFIDFHHDNTTGSDYSVRLQTNGNHSNVVTLPTATGTLALTSDNVASATKLQTARTIWGQSFNGTGNVSGALSGATTISASNTISTSLQNGALKIGNKSAPISAIDAQVIFNTGAAVRFGETAWDWNQWAGLKYTHSNKTVYLGIADGSVFNANHAQSGGKLQLKAIDRILFDSDSDSFQIHCDNSNDYLRIGSSDNSGYVLVSDIGNWDTDDNGDDTNNWLISIDGTGTFKSIYCPSIYTANSIISTRNKALLLSENVIREYHRDGSPYYSSITFNETTLDLSAYGNIGLTSSHGITIEGGSGTISMVASGGFDVTYRAASLSVSQTGASEYTWTFNNGSIKTTGGITAYQSSDERLKHNIHGVDSLAIIKAMGGTVAFRYNEDDKASIGWIAQRVLHNTLMQDLVEKDEDGYLKINYWSPKLIAVAFGAIEQVDDEVAKLKARVRELENEVEQLKSDRL